MAGDWLKWTKGLERKREVLIIAHSLGRTPEEVAARLMKLWDWCDDNITEEQIDENGHAFVTLGKDHLHLIDALAGVSGFADAMTTAGWIIQRSGSLTFPNYSRHNGKTAKSRALCNKRKRQERSRSCHARSVTKTGLEKRREESNTPLPPFSKNVDTPKLRKALDDWLAYKGRKYKPRGLQALVTRLEFRVLHHGEQAVINAIERAMSQGYKGWDFDEWFEHKPGKTPQRLPTPEEDAEWTP